MTYAVAIGLKIPDNAAYTALTTLRRLGIDVALVERNEIVHVDAPNALEAAQMVRDDESLFNPNKHRLAVLEEDRPREGEAWIERVLDPSNESSPVVAWRLYAGPARPVSRETLVSACERLLCNSAVERAIFH
jgi:hypothetical protein